MVVVSNVVKDELKRLFGGTSLPLSGDLWQFVGSYRQAVKKLLAPRRFISQRSAQARWIGTGVVCFPNHFFLIKDLSELVWHSCGRD